MKLIFDTTQFELEHNKQIFKGTNALDKLFELSETSLEAQKLFEQIANNWKTSIVPTLGFKLFNNAIRPKKIRVSDVGYDIYITNIKEKINDHVTMYDTNVSLMIPQGYYVELHARSSLFKTGHILANSVGIIDPNYTGTIKVPLLKYNKEDPDLELPFRACQLILKPYAQSYCTKVEYIHETNRGDGGFGSTNM